MNSVKEINDKLSFDLDKIVGPETFEGLWENHKKVIVKRNSSPFNEAKILLKVCNLHNGIIGYFGKYNDLNHHYMVLEHYRFTLADFIIKDDHNSIKKLRENVSKVNLLQEICEGLSFLHCKNIVLGSLKSQNIIFSKNHKAKIAYFGAAREIPIDSFQATVWGSDIKILGDIFVFVLTKNRCFASLQDFNARSGIIQDRVLAIDLIALMINENIESRPAINEILKSPYFWSPKKKLEFFFDIRKILDLKDEMANNLRDEIDHFASVIEEDWTQNLSFDVMEDINKTMRKHDKGMISDLLRFIRNKQAHSAEWSLSLKFTFGPTDSSFYGYFDGQFPKLFKHIYDVIKGGFRDNFAKYFFDLNKKLDLECLILDLSKEIPEMCNSYKSLQELTLENCFGVNDKLVVFLKENCLALNSLCVKSCELKMQELIDIFICLPHLKSVTLNGSSISFKLKEDKNQSLPVLSELSELKLKDVQDSNIFRILMKFTNLHKIEITNLKNVDKHFKGFILQQKNMKILRTKESEIFNSLFSDSISCNFQLTCLNLVSAQTYSQNNCLNFLKFIATQNQLEDVCVTIKLGSIKEYSSYFNHVLSLKTLTAINIDSSNTCAKYFESSKVVNETVSSLKFRLHNGLQYYSSFMKKIPFIFPKLETISFEVNKNLQQISWDQEVLDGYSDSSSSDEGFQHMKENRSWQNDNCLLFANYRKSIDESSKNSLNSRSSQLSIQPLSSMMNLREIELELESSNELSLLEIEALKSCRLTIKNYSDIKRNNFKYLNSVKFVDNEHFDIFFKNHSHLKTLQVFFDVIEEYHLNGLIEELVELILQLNLEELVLSCVSEKYYTYDTAKLFEICQESESLKFVKLFGTEKKY